MNDMLCYKLNYLSMCHVLQSNDFSPFGKVDLASKQHLQSNDFSPYNLSPWRLTRIDALLLMKDEFLL
jgi:hypothetical protein